MTVLEELESTYFGIIKPAPIPEINGVLYFTWEAPIMHAMIKVQPDGRVFTACEDSGWIEENYWLIVS